MIEGLGDLNPYREGEPLWHVWRAEVGVGHYPTPADLPHPPASAEGQCWTRELLAWQMSSRNPWLAARKAEVDAERRRIVATLALSPEQAATARTLHELDPSAWRLVHDYTPHATARRQTTAEAFAAMAEAFKPIGELMTQLVVSVYDALAPLAKLIEHWHVSPSRHARGRARPNPPQQSLGLCHHRNPRNACRECSTRKGHAYVQRDDTRGSRPDARGAARSVRGARSGLPSADRRRQR